MTMLISESLHSKALKIFFAAPRSFAGSIATRLCRLLREISIASLFPDAFFGCGNRIFHSLMVNTGQNRIEALGNLMQILEGQLTLVQLAVMCLTITRQTLLMDSTSAACGGGVTPAA